MARVQEIAQGMESAETNVKTCRVQELRIRSPHMKDCSIPMSQECNATDAADAIIWRRTVNFATSSATSVGKFSTFATVCKSTRSHKNIPKVTDQPSYSRISCRQPEKSRSPFLQSNHLRVMCLRADMEEPLFYVL